MLPPEQFKEIYKAYRIYYKNEAQLQILQRKITRAKKTLKMASEAEIAHFVQELVDAYLNLDELEEPSARKRLEEALIREAFMVKSIKKEG